jgi:hypothetical protein
LVTGVSASWEKITLAACSGRRILLFAIALQLSCDCGEFDGTTERRILAASIELPNWVFSRGRHNSLGQPAVGRMRT